MLPPRASSHLDGGLFVIEQSWWNTKTIAMSLLALLLLIWLWFQIPLWWVRLEPSMPYKEITLFEPRFTSEQVMQSQGGQNLFQESEDLSQAQVELFPYLLMEVKYLRGDKSLESTVLWSLNQGEILLDTTQWEMTHGYYDCLIHGAGQDEMTIINALANKGGTLDRESLLRMVHRDGDEVDDWIHRCIKKQLIVQIGNIYKLHLQNPKLALEPKTKINVPLRKKRLAFNKVITPKYRPQAIVALAHASFGSGFSIRRQQLVYLPVYSILAKFSDASTATTKWNAHTGHLMNLEED